MNHGDEIEVPQPCYDAECDSNHFARMPTQAEWRVEVARLQALLRESFGKPLECTHGGKGSGFWKPRALAAEQREKIRYENGPCCRCNGKEVRDASKDGWNPPAVIAALEATLAGKQQELNDERIRVRRANAKITHLESRLCGSMCPQREEGLLTDLTGMAYAGQTMMGSIARLQRKLAAIQTAMFKQEEQA